MGSRFLSVSPFRLSVYNPFPRLWLADAASYGREVDAVGSAGKASQPGSAAWHRSDVDPTDAIQSHCAFILLAATVEGVCVNLEQWG